MLVIDVGKARLGYVEILPSIEFGEEEPSYSILF